MIDEIKEQVVVGMYAEEFLESPLGKSVLELSKFDSQIALEAFCEVDLSDGAKVSKIQQDAIIARRFNQYLVELITRGREALDAQK